MTFKSKEEIERLVASLDWYHTIDFGNGIISRGHYDLRDYLKYYGIPEDLSGQTVLDIGAASGFFSFEMERRGADVTATDLPDWDEHDFGPRFQQEATEEEKERYLHEPFLLAKRILGSRVKRVLTNIYDISPESFGTFDLVFCASVLLHLTDPIKALWHIRSVTKGMAIIVTGISPDNNKEPKALFVGHHHGTAWWLPNRACMEAMVQAAGFTDYEWVSDFRLDYTDGTKGTHHGVVKAWINTGKKMESK